MTPLSENTNTIDSSVSIRFTKPEDAEGLVKLAAGIHGTQSDPASWRWKYHSNPLGECVSTALLKEDRPVGHIGGLTTQFIVDGIRRIGAQELDIYIEEAHRGGGAYFQMLKFRRKYHEPDHPERIPIDFSYGFANDLSARVATHSPKAFRYLKVAPLPRLVKLVNWKPLIAGRLAIPLLPWLLGNLLNGCSWLLSRRRVLPPQGTRLIEIEQFDDRFNDFWESIQTDYRIMLRKTSDYLNWRYCSIPGVKLKIFAIEDQANGSIRGFTVLGSRLKGVQRGVFYELLTPRSGDPQITQALLDRALLYFQQIRVATAVCWMFEHGHAYPELEKRGFQVRPAAGHNLLYRDFAGTIPEEVMLNREHWFLSMGDSDI